MTLSKLRHRGLGAVLMALSVFFSTALLCASPVLSFKHLPAGLVIHEKTGTLNIELLTSGIAHVVFSPGDKKPLLQNFVVTAKPQLVTCKIIDTAQSIALFTTRFGIEVNRATGALAFVRPDQTVILQESATGTRRFIASQINRQPVLEPQQSFLAQPDEVQYGLAETQGGLWNRRGMPIELCQLNTQCAVPMMISSAGYGLLWNNAALTWFNPVDHQVTLDAKGEGTFTAGKSGQYVFMVRNGNRRTQIGVTLNGKIINEIVNRWVPYTIAAKAPLTAGTTYQVGIIGGGKTATLWIGPRRNRTVFRSAMGYAIDYYFFYGPHPQRIIQEYRQATGAAPMFPRWAYGFWQCRERYSSQKQILQSAAGFRKRQIPVDLIIQDWQYWKSKEWSAFNFDPKRYPDPRKMIQQLHAMHFHYMLSVWQNNTYQSPPYLPKVHGKIGGYLDVFNPAAGAVRWGHMKQAFFDIGADAWWQDATEPGDGGGLAGGTCYAGPTAWYRNAYPLYANQDVYEGQRAASSAKRVVILSRSAYLGQQRTAAAVWSGDINGTWQFYRRQISAGLNFCMAGLPYWTTDTGGFFRPADQYTSKAYHELLIRWFEFSTFCPILRIHGYHSATEMWHYGPDTMDTLKFYDQLRYRLLPYIYSLAWGVTHRGNSIIEPLAAEFPDDSHAWKVAHEYMFGPAILVAPVLEPLSEGGGQRAVYLPAGTDWFDFWTGQKYTGGRTVTVPTPLNRIPLFVKAGSIIPLGPVMQYATQSPANPIELRLYPGANGQFTFYEDQNNNYNYEKGVYATILFQLTHGGATLNIGSRQGTFPGMLKSRVFRVVLVKPGTGVGAEASAHAATVQYDGKNIILPLH